MDLAKLTARIARDGFDIVQAFPVYEVAIDPAFALLAQSPAHTIGVLVGNTRALWPHVMAARADDPTTFDRGHPFDNYTRVTMTAIERELGTRTVYAHEPDRAGRFFPFQRLAVAVGLAALAPSQLLIHSTYGPWFALRAVILAEGVSPPLSPRAALPCDCAKAGCVARFDHAMAHPDDWRAWLAVRDACPIGRAYRYSDDQLAYHYTKDARYLPVIG